jgi:CHAT domain-containing protein
METRIVPIARAVQGGVRWLKEAASSMQEARALAVTTSALVAAEKNPHSNLVQRLVGDLVAKQGQNGSWNDELWDTTWAIQALLDGGMPPTSIPIQRGLRFLKVTQDPIDGTWYEEPFETMLVLALLFRLEPEQFASRAERALEWLASLQRNDGMLVGTRYTGMAVALFHKVQASERGERVVRLGLESLETLAAQRGIWTAASWSNCYALMALLDSGRNLADPGVSAAVDWFLKNQEGNGRWMQVSEVHDTAMAVLALSRLLTVPLVDLSVPQVAVINASRENGTVRVSFQPPGVGAIAPSERMKISEAVRSELGANQQRMLSAMGRMRSTQPIPTSTREPPVQEELLKIGQYTYGHLIPERIQVLLENSKADHLRLDVDERLIDLPWELIHDGRDFLCLRYAAGRRLVSDQAIHLSGRRPRPARGARALVVANPTMDLPAAEAEGTQVAELLREKCNMEVDYFRGDELDKKGFLLSLRNYDVVHFAGHAEHDAENPDESCLRMSDGGITAFEIARFLKDQSPPVVFLNACWSAEELRDPDSYSPMMRGLGRTFMYAGVNAFIGYLVPVPDVTATKFAVAFYSSLSEGQSIGESIRRARIIVREGSLSRDLTWASAVLYGDPSVRVFEPASP